MSTSSPSAAPSHDPSAQFGAKRRRLRKGTHSCWECKRRKMKCIYEPLANTCNGCWRRGCQCLTQEFPDVASSMGNTLPSPSPDYGGEGMGRIQTRYTPYVGHENNFSNGITPTTPPMTAEPPRHLDFIIASQVRMPAILEMITLANTTLIRLAASTMTVSHLLLIRQQPNKARMRGCLASCMDLSLRKKILKGYSQPAITLLSSPMRS